MFRLSLVVMICFNWCGSDRALDYKHMPGRLCPYRWTSVSVSGSRWPWITHICFHRGCPSVYICTVSWILLIVDVGIQRWTSVTGILYDGGHGWTSVKSRTIPSASHVTCGNSVFVNHVNFDQDKMYVILSIKDGPSVIKPWFGGKIRSEGSETCTLSDLFFEYSSGKSNHANVKCLQTWLVDLRLSCCYRPSKILVQWNSHEIA